MTDKEKGGDANQRNYEMALSEYQRLRGLAQEAHSDGRVDDANTYADQAQEKNKTAQHYAQLLGK